MIQVSCHNSTELLMTSPVIRIMPPIILSLIISIVMVIIDIMAAGVLIGCVSVTVSMA